MIYLLVIYMTASPIPPAMFYILFALADGDKHGYAIMQEMRRISEGKFRIGPATLYTNVERMLEAGLIEEVDGEEDSRRRYYRLAKQGRALLKEELQRMHRVLQRARHLSPAIKVTG